MLYRIVLVISDDLEVLQKELASASYHKRVNLPEVTSLFCITLQDAHEFLNFLLNEIVDTLEKECSTAKDSPETTSPEEVSNGAVNHLANGVQKEPLVTWVHKNFQVTRITEK